jgi:hypothetical protein
MSAGEFEGHDDLIAELRAGTLDAPDHLHRRVLAGGTEKRRRWAEMSGRRRVLVLVPVAAAFAVGAAVVHGAFFNSGSPQAHALAGAVGAQDATGASGAVGHTGPAGPAYSGGITHRPARSTPLFGPPSAEATKSARTFPTGMPSTTLAPVHGNARLDAANSLTAFSTHQSAVNIPNNRKVHADASLQVVVPNHDALSSATNKATAIVTSLGGYAQSVQYQASRQGDGNSVLDLRVPVGKVEVAMQKLGSLGRLVSQQVSTQDLQQTYSQQTDTIGRLRRSIAVYEQALQNGSLSGSQRVNVQIQLANARYKLAALRRARGHLVKYAATSDIQLTLSTNQHAFAVPPGKRGRFGQLLHNAATFLALEGIIVLYALIVAGPILLIVGLVWWLTRERRRREERELLASA